MADKKYDFSAFDQPASKYDFSAFDSAEARQPASIDNNDTLQTLDDAARGVAQGASFGFSDELAGGLEAGSDILAGKTSMERFIDAYRQHRDESRALNKAAEERSPTAYTLGNLGGGVAPALLTGGASAPTQALGLLSRLKSAGQIGAASGALTGLGTSEAPTISGDIENAIESAAGGAVLGSGIQGGAELIKGTGRAVRGVGKAIADTQLGKDVIDAFKFGQSGTNIVSSSGLNEIESNARKAASNLGLGARQAQKEAGVELGTVKQGIRESGKNFDVSDEVNKVQSLIDNLKRSDNPDAIKDVEFLQKYLDNLLLGKESEIPVQMSKFTPGKEISPKPSSRDALELEASKSRASAKALGQDLKTNIIPSEDDAGNKLLTLLKSTDENVGAAERAIPIKDENGNIIDHALDLGENINNKTSASAKTVLDNPAVEGGFTSSERGPIVTEMQKVRQGGINPSQVNYSKAEDINKTLTDFGGVTGTPSLKTQEAINQSRLLAKSVKDKITQIPELAEGNKNYAAASQALETLGLKSDDFVKDAVTGEIRLDATAKTKMNGIVRRMARDTDAGDNAAEKLTQALDLIKQTNPKIAEALGPEVQSTSRALDLAQKAQRLGLLNRSTYLKSGSITASNLVGRGTDIVKKAISSATPDDLKQVAQSLIQKGSPSGMKLASHLSEAMRKDNVGRNAALFSLQQDPNYRQMLKEYFQEEEK